MCGPKKEDQCFTARETSSFPGSQLSGPAVCSSSKSWSRRPCAPSPPAWEPGAPPAQPSPAWCVRPAPPARGQDPSIWGPGSPRRPPVGGYLLFSPCDLEQAPPPPLTWLPRLPNQELGQLSAPLPSGVPAKIYLVSRKVDALGDQGEGLQP